MFTVTTTSGFKMILEDAGKDANGDQLWRQVRVVSVIDGDADQDQPTQPVPWVRRLHGYDE